MPGRDVKPRRRPKTVAGERIADAVVIAAEQLLSADGLDHFSTNRIARRAGVSVGSLYQYFPNKESLLAEVKRRVERRTSDEIVGALESSRDLTLRETVQRVIDVLIGDDLGALRMRRVLRQEVPSSWTDETSADVDREVREALERELARRTDIRDGSLELFAFVVAHAIEMLVEHAVLTQPELLTSAAFRAELCELAVRYLRVD